MRYAKPLLEQHHIEQVLRQDLLIGSDTAHDGRQKRFVFNPWGNEYRVLHGGEQVDGGQAMEELLTVYNEL